MKPSKKFIVDGNNLVMTLDLMPWDAALGGKIPVDTIDGRINVTIPPRIQTGKKIRVSGKGYIDRKGKRGDLIIMVRIVNPSNITGEAIKLYEKIGFIHEGVKRDEINKNGVWVDSVIMSILETEYESL